MDGEKRDLWLQAYHKCYPVIKTDDKYQMPILPKPLCNYDEEELNLRLNENYPTPNKDITYDKFKEVIYFRGLPPPLAWHLYALRYMIKQWIKHDNRRMADTIFDRNPYFTMWYDFDPEDIRWVEVIGKIPLEKDPITHLKKLKASDHEICDAMEDVDLKNRWEEIILNLAKKGGTYRHSKGVTMTLSDDAKKYIKDKLDKSITWAVSV